MKFLLLVSALFVLLLTNCATIPPKTVNSQPIFYPLPPDEPRIQFLTSYSTSTDITGRSNPFQAFIIGEKEENPIVKPYGFAVWQNKIYVCDTQLQAIIILDIEEKSFNYFSPRGKGILSKPINITIDNDGTKYVADTAREAVVVFDAANNYAGVLAKEGGMTPTDVVIHGERLYITDLKNSNVTVWDKRKRELLSNIPVGNSEEARLFSPVNLALDSEGNLYVSDIGAFRVQIYDREGNFMRSIGSLGDAFGQLARPKGIAVDTDGRLYVVDAAFEVVQLFDREGKLLMFFGQPQEDEYILSLPAKIRIDKTLLSFFQDYAAPSFEIEYLIFVTSQYGGKKISVFGFGRQSK